MSPFHSCSFSSLPSQKQFGKRQNKNCRSEDIKTAVTSAAAAPSVTPPPRPTRPLRRLRTERSRSGGRAHVCRPAAFADVSRRTRGRATLRVVVTVACEAMPLRGSGHFRVDSKEVASAVLRVLCKGLWVVWKILILVHCDWTVARKIIGLPAACSCVPTAAMKIRRCPSAWWKRSRAAQPQFI